MSPLSALEGRAARRGLVLLAAVAPEGLTRVLFFGGGGGEVS